VVTSSSNYLSHYRQVELIQDFYYLSLSLVLYFPAVIVSKDYWIL